MGLAFGQPHQGELGRPGRRFAGMSSEIELAEPRRDRDPGAAVFLVLMVLIGSTTATAAPVPPPPDSETVGSEV